jgi:hypothetical protein
MPRCLSLQFWELVPSQLMISAGTIQRNLLWIEEKKTAFRASNLFLTIVIYFVTKYILARNI